MQALILLVCSIILTSFVRELQGIDLLHGKLMKNPKLLLDKGNVLRECFCLPVNNGGKRVSEVISPEGKHKGRLVVYIYKNPNNQLTAYVPNREKQLAIPDLTMDEGEALEKITNSKVKDLFETSPSIVIPKPGKHLTDHGYIQFNLNKYLNELPNINENHNLNELNPPQNTEQQGINNETPGSVLHFESQEPTDITNDHMHIDSEKILQLYEESLQKPEGSLQIPGGSLQIPGGSQQIPGESLQIPGGSLKIPGGSQQIPEGSLQIPGESLQIPDGSQQIPGELLQIPGESLQIPGGSLQIPEGSLQIPGGSLQIPGGSKQIPEISLQIPGGSLQIPGGSQQIPGGSLQIPGGSLQIPGGSLQIPGESLQIPEGSLQIPGGSLQISEGSQQIPGGSLQIPGGSLQIPEGTLQIPKDLESIVTNPHRLPQHTHPESGPENGNVLSPEVSGSVEHRPDTETPQAIETYIVPSPGQQEKQNDNIVSPLKPQQPSEIPNQEPQPFTQTNNAEILPGTPDQTSQDLPGTTSDNSIDLSIGTKPKKTVVVQPSPDKGKFVITENIPNSAIVIPNENIEVSNEPNLQDSDHDLSYNLLPMKQFHDLLLNFPNEHPNKGIVFPQGYRPPKHTLSDKMTFDQWLLEQIRILQLHKPFMSYSINIEALKLVIVRALQNNGISVSSTGVLKDSNGKTVQISNLQLQPILLGDPVEYEKLLALNKCILPYNLPYLQAMFVTLSYPPRILGIIYLGGSYHKCSHGLCPHKTRCHSDHCRQSGVSHTQTVIVHTKSTPGYSQVVEIPGSDKYNLKLNNKLLGAFSRRTNGDLESDNSLHQLIPDSALEPLPGDNISRQNEVNDENIQPLEDAFSSDHNKVEDVGDYDDLGIRIIGGQPATASGTPITSKGRSGYED